MRGMLSEETKAKHCYCYSYWNSTGTCFKSSSFVSAFREGGTVEKLRKSEPAVGSALVPVCFCFSDRRRVARCDRGRGGGGTRPAQKRVGGIRIPLQSIEPARYKQHVIATLSWAACTTTGCEYALKLKAVTNCSCSEPPASPTAWR